MKSFTLSWPQPEQPNGIILDYELRFYEKVRVQCVCGLCVCVCVCVCVSVSLCVFVRETERDRDCFYLI